MPTALTPPGGQSVNYTWSMETEGHNEIWLINSVSNLNPKFCCIVKKGYECLLQHVYYS